MNSIFSFQTGVWITTFFFLFVNAQDKLTSQEKSDCANKLVDWCEKNEFDKNNYGISTTSFTDSKNGKYAQITCSKDYGGITCTKNHDPLFFCSRTKRLFYKDDLIQKDSSNAFDDDICYALNITNEMYQRYQKSMADLNVRMKDLRSNLSSQFDRQRENLSHEMEKLNDRMESMRRKFSRPCFPFCNN